MKKKITLIIILCIISCGIVVYGATKYDASEILYNASDGTSMDVNDALNELYEKANSSGCNSGICYRENIARVGDYVKMTPTNTTYTISKELTGYDSNQTIKPSELNLWRIIKINENGTIEMISENVSSTNVIFYGQTGYLNFVGALNEIASQYENSKYTIDSRIIGYNGQTEYLTDTSKITYPAPWIYNTKDNSNETVGGGDVMYEADTNLVVGVLGTLAANNSSGTANSYFLCSRLYAYGNSNSYGWYGRYMLTNGTVYNAQSLYYYQNGWKSYSNGSAIRPILTLKSGITVTGRGTSEDPWVLE